MKLQAEEFDLCFPGNREPLKALEQGESLNQSSTLGRLIHAVREKESDLKRPEAGLREAKREMHSSE